MSVTRPTLTPLSRAGLVLFSSIPLCAQYGLPAHLFTPSVHVFLVPATGVGMGSAVRGPLRCIGSGFVVAQPAKLMSVSKINEHHKSKVIRSRTKTLCSAGLIIAVDLDGRHDLDDQIALSVQDIGVLALLFAPG